MPTVLVTVFLAMGVLVSGPGRVGKPSMLVSGSAAIDALVAAPGLGKLYFEDGASDGTIVSEPQPTVRAVLDILVMGERAIPTLIGCLDDTRLTSATFDGGFTRGKPLKVPVGFVCLDILTHIVKPLPKIFFKDCADDGLGACIERGYYFRPDEYYPAGETYVARGQVHVAKKNWSQAYRQKTLRFQYPQRFP